MPKTNLLNPFNPFYQDNDVPISECPEIQEIDQYVYDLEDKIEGDFDLGYIQFEFIHNRLAYIRSGLLLAKLKFLKLYKNFGDGTFASFCSQQLRITRWQINDNIRASRVAMELIYAGFAILPSNISQAIALSSLSGEELVRAWRLVLETIEGDRITTKSIRALIFPPTEKDLPVAKIQVTPTLHENLHSEAAERGISIVELVQQMFDYFTKNVTVHNSHLSSHENSTVDDAEKQRIWREDLKKLVEENKSKE